MKYIARYPLTQTNKAAAIAAWKEMAANNSYYGMYGGGGSPFVSRSSSGGLWGDWYAFGHHGENLHTLVESASDEAVIETVERFCETESDTVGWHTCAGNYAGLRVRKNDILLEMSGHRHGIPSYFVEEFKHFEPLEVIKYESMRQDASPFAVGLLPPQKLLDEVIAEARSMLPKEWDVMPKLKASSLLTEVLNKLEDRGDLPFSWRGEVEKQLL